MDKIVYPILFFEVNPSTVLGVLVGTDYQLVDKDVRSVKNNLSDYLSRQYKKYDSYPDIDLKESRLKLYDIEVRPSYTTKSGTFPYVDTVELQVPVVYGENYIGHYECYLPLLGQSFYYYEKDQLDPLVQNLAVNRLSNYSPEALFQLAKLQQPVLDHIVLKVNFDRDFDWTSLPRQRHYKFLDRLAERYPYTKAVRRQMSNLPEAAWEMEDKVAEVIDKVLLQRANILLVGNSGVGKSAVLRQAIRKMHNLGRKEKLELSFWRILSQRITASSKYLGEWQEAVEGLLEDLKLANGILWVEDVVRLLESGGNSPEVSVAAYLISFIQRGDLQIIGELSPRELESMRRMLPGFAETFQLIEIPEPSEKKNQAILKHFANHIEQQHAVLIPDSCLSLAYRLLNRYYPYESFPGKGIKFLGKCVNEAQLKAQQVLEKKDIIEAFITQTGLPALFLRDDLLLDQQELSQYFASRIIGQEAAVEKICDIVKIYKAGLNNPHKPITTLLFAGPTGVGKTASAKAMADYFFGKGQLKSPLVRIDMSEFQSPYQVYRLIGHGKEVGQLVKSIRERPFSVLLLDEVEKANSAVFDALLTVLDEGILVDAYGRTTNFRNTIIIMTTNLGASNRRSIGFRNTTSDEAKYLSAIGGFFRPEFVNRIDNVALFNPLEKNSILQICRKELSELNKREGLEKRGLQLSFSEGLIEQLITIGFDEKYGARPLQRAIEQQVVHPLAQWLLAQPKAQNGQLHLDFTPASGLEIQWRG
ncbi:MAG: ATP-dependent Clp protease ATP-binding subunit [Phaeodactylibacter sp.]|nr:ATP-dependent Clp protease ATP-binding subunit [Phaeodactylibacter sp.]